MKKLLFFIGFICSYLYPPEFSFYLSLIRSIIYTGWRKRTFSRFEGFLNYPINTTGADKISIGKNSVIGKGTILQAWSSFKGQTFSPSIIIGNDCHIGQFSHITAIGNITIEDGVLTGRRVLISDNSHGRLEDSLNGIMPELRQLKTKGDVHICKNAWLGDNVVVLSGVTIGEGAIIGANAVVNKNVEPYSIFAGVPAKRIR